MGFVVDAAHHTPRGAVTSCTAGSLTATRRLATPTAVAAPTSVHCAPTSARCRVLGRLPVVVAHVRRRVDVDPRVVFCTLQCQPSWRRPSTVKGRKPRPPSTVHSAATGSSADSRVGYTDCSVDLGDDVERHRAPVTHSRASRTLRGRRRLRSVRSRRLLEGGMTYSMVACTCRPPNERCAALQAPPHHGARPHRAGTN